MANGLPTRYLTPSLGNLRGLTAKTFDPGELKNPIVGDYGRRAIGQREVGYRLPAQYSPAVLAAMSPEELAQVEQQASRAYDELEQNWRSVIPEGYTGIFATEDGPISGPDPMANPENQRRAQALNLISQIRTGARNAAGQQQQGVLRAQNQLAAGLADQGYELDLRGNAMQTLWENRNSLPGFVKTAGARNFIKRKGEKFAYENTPYSAGQLGIGYEGDSGGVELPVGYQPGGFPKAQPMPYDPADPLSEADYYGGRPIVPPAEGDRIVRPAGDTGYGNLRPGFYTGGGVTGPETPRSLPGRAVTDINAPQYAANTEYPVDGYAVTPPKVNKFGAPEGRSLRPRTTMASFGLPTSTRIGV